MLITSTLGFKDYRGYHDRLIFMNDIFTWVAIAIFIVIIHRSRDSFLYQFPLWRDYQGIKRASRETRAAYSYFFSY